MSEIVSPTNIQISPLVKPAPSAIAAPLSASNAISACEEILYTLLKTRDESHGISHAFAVRDNALKIMSLSPPLPSLGTTTLPPGTLVEISSLLHDVLDHKYLAKEPEMKGRLEVFMENTLTERDRSVVESVIKNVSYSKEVRGDLRLSDLTPFVLMLRNVVSDADKIEALGSIGLQRCMEYAVETGSVGDEVFKHVAEHCDGKLLRLKDEFIRTEGGKIMAVEGHEYLRKWRLEIGSKYVE